MIEYTHKQVFLEESEAGVFDSVFTGRSDRQ